MGSTIHDVASMERCLASNLSIFYMIFLDSSCSTWLGPCHPYIASACMHTAAYLGGICDTRIFDTMSCSSDVVTFKSRLKHDGIRLHDTFEISYNALDFS
jgi:hypothetical protein